MTSAASSRVSELDADSGIDFEGAYVPTRLSSDDYELIHSNDTCVWLKLSTFKTQYRPRIGAVMYFC